MTSGTNPPGGADRIRVITDPRVLGHMITILGSTGHRKAKDLTPRLIEAVARAGYALIRARIRATVARLEGQPLPLLDGMQFIQCYPADPYPMVTVSNGSSVYPITSFGVRLAIASDELDVIEVVGALYSHCVGDAVKPYMWSLDRADGEDFTFGLRRRRSTYEIAIRRTPGSDLFVAECNRVVEPGKEFHVGAETTLVKPIGSGTIPIRQGGEVNSLIASGYVFIRLGAGEGYPSPDDAFDAMVRYVPDGPA